jgi:uncharacterized membrane protein (DUF373 family)
MRARGIVLEVALIAVARKVVIIDVKEYAPASLFAIAAIVLALAGAYYLQRRGCDRKRFSKVKDLESVNSLTEMDGSQSGHEMSR